MLVKVVGESTPLDSAAEEDVDEDGQIAEQEIARYLLKVLCDGSPLVRAELAIGKQLDGCFMTP